MEHACVNNNGDAECLHCKGKGFLKPLQNGSSVNVCNYCSGLGKVFRAKRSKGVGWDSKAKGIHEFKCSQGHVFYTDDNEVNASSVGSCPVCKSNVSGVPFYY